VNSLKAWYAGLQPREQRVVGFGGVALAVLIVLGGLLLPLEGAVSAARKRAEMRRADLEWMRVNGPEILAGGTPTVESNEPPVVLVDRIGREAGLGSALRGTQPSGTGVRVQLEGAPFDTLVAWLATLEERHGLAIESISVDHAAKPGLVNANITFSQAKR
jgi:general secretion pathway protein M